jgi:phosphate transport system substrate-binding protein
MSATDPAAGTPTAESVPPKPVIRRKSGSRALLVVLVILVVIIVVGVAAYQLKWIGATKSSTTSCPTGITLQGEGANLILQIMSVWESGYAAQTSNLVNYNPAGSGAGITAITAPTVDFAATDNPMNASQAAAVKSPLLTLPVIGGAVAVVYNLPGLPKSVQLSGPLLADIYLGVINNWNATWIQQNNSGLKLPNETIIAVHRADAAGTTYVLTNMMSEDSPAWASGPGTSEAPKWPTIGNSIAESKNSGVLSYVQATPYAIGYVDLTDTLNTPGMQYAKILNPSGLFILPNLADTESAISNMSARISFPNSTGDWTGVSLVNSPGRGDYPLVTFAYFFVYQSMSASWSPNLQKSEVLLQWLHWALSTGQGSAATNYYSPLPASVVAVDEAGLGTVTYNGAAVPSCS